MYMHICIENNILVAEYRSKKVSRVIYFESSAFGKTYCLIQSLNVKIFQQRILRLKQHEVYKIRKNVKMYTNSLVYIV